MILFFDSSALLKRYITETGSQKVDSLFLHSKELIVSPITKIEIHSAMKRLLIENRIIESEYNRIINEINIQRKNVSGCPQSLL